MTFEDRLRFTLDEARAKVTEPGNLIRHITDNGDGTYSIVGHVNCDWCDFCGVPEGEFLSSKSNIFELQERRD